MAVTPGAVADGISRSSPTGVRRTVSRWQRRTATAVGGVRLDVARTACGGCPGPVPGARMFPAPRAAVAQTTDLPDLRHRAVLDGTAARNRASSGVRLAPTPVRHPLLGPAATHPAPSATCHAGGRSAPGPGGTAQRSSATSAWYASAGRSASSTTCSRVAASWSTSTCWDDALGRFALATRPTRYFSSLATSWAAADPRPLRKACSGSVASTRRSHSCTPRQVGSSGCAR